MDRTAGLKRGQVKLLEQVMKLSEEVEELKEMILLKWKMEDERYGEYRWPYDQDGEYIEDIIERGKDRRKFEEIER